MDQKFGQGQWKTVQHGDAEVANHIGHAGRGHYTAICRRTSMAIWTPGIKHLKSCQILPDQRSTKIHLSALVVWQASPAQSFLPLQWHGCSWGSCWCELILLRFSLQVASSISLGSCAWFDALSTDRFVQMMQRSSPRRCMQSCQPPNLEKFVRENHGTISSRDCFQHLLNGLPMTARFLAFGTLLLKLPYCRRTCSFLCGETFRIGRHVGKKTWLWMIVIELHVHALNSMLCLICLFHPRRLNPYLAPRHVASYSWDSMHHSLNASNVLLETWMLWN